MMRFLLGCGLLAIGMALAYSFARGQDKAPADAFKVKSVWVDETDAEKSLTVTEREGEKFKATFKYRKKIEREITGTIKAGKVSWLAKDVRAIRGDAGGDNQGTLGNDEKGDKIDFVWENPNRDVGGKGKFTLRLEKAK
jgi:hypothetical protein